MNVNLREDVKPISYIKTNTVETIDPLSLIKLLQFPEKSIREGKVNDNDQVFLELRKKLVK
jgi:hypothetical protein